MSVRHDSRWCWSTTSMTHLGSVQARTARRSTAQLAVSKSGCRNATIGHGTNRVSSVRVLQPCFFPSIQNKASRPSPTHDPRTGSCSLPSSASEQLWHAMTETEVLASERTEHARAYPFISCFWGARGRCDERTATRASRLGFSARAAAFAAACAAGGRSRRGARGKRGTGLAHLDFLSLVLYQPGQRVGGLAAVVAASQCAGEVHRQSLHLAGNGETHQWKAERGTLAGG